MKHTVLAGALASLLLAFPDTGYADANGVGLGVAIGAAYSPTTFERVNNGQDVDAGSSFAWGFFVDIPLLETFYITPAAMLYEVNFDGEKKPVTDIDLNFKFIVPLGRARLGAGLTAGLSNAELTYRGHYGALGIFSYNLVSNLDVFLLAQYKRMPRDGQDLDNLHGFAGVMFHF